MAKEYVAYSGAEFQIEWYYSESGKSQAFEYYRELSRADREKVLYLFKTMCETGVLAGKSKFRYEGDKIYAFKPHPHRFLCFFFEGGKIIVTNAFWKKQDKLPNEEKQRALRSKESYVKRIANNNYHEKEE